MNIALRIVLLNCILLFATIAAAQKQTSYNYDASFGKIDSLALSKQPKIALALIKSINEQARKEGKTDMLIKSVMYRMLFLNYLEPNTQANLISALKQDINLAKQPEKSILQSLLAESYWFYIQQNRYRISQRSQVNADIGEDISTWSVKKLNNETVSSYLASLSEEMLLKNTKIDDIQSVIIGDKASRYLRPTIYDLLAHRALSVFMNTQIDISSPKAESVKFGNDFFKEAKSFSNISLSSPDSTSVSTITLKIFQDLIKLHIDSKNQAALVDTEIKRLKFVYERSGEKNKSLYFLKALQKLAPLAQDAEIYADVLFEQAVLFRDYPVNSEDRTNLSKAVELAERAIQTYPESLGAKNARQLIDGIKLKALTIVISNQQLLNKPIQIHFSHKNTDSVYLKLYKISTTDYQTFDTLRNKESYFRFLKNQKSIKDWQVSLPKENDYHTHTFADYFEGLPFGNYVVIAQNNHFLGSQNENSITSYANFRVSNLSVISRTIESTNHQYIVTNSLDGKPIKDVKIDQRIKRSYTAEWVSGGAIKTDERGMASSDTFQYVNDALITLNKDTLLINVSDRPQSYRPQNRILLFTDRPIYRPGHTVFYKGLYMQTFDSKNKIITNEQVLIDFMDANEQSIAKDTVTTNEYGTFQGSFLIPMGKLNGTMHIQTNHGEIGVQVEEYKRPTFEVLFDKSNERYKLMDSVKIKGSAISFSGYQIGNAIVKYTVIRTRMRDYRSRYNEDFTPIVTGNTKTSDDGTFSLSFLDTTVRDNKGYNYNFDINVEVTDLNGETRSGIKQIKVGDKDILLDLKFPDHIFTGTKPDSLHISVSNLNGEPINAKVSVEWQPLIPSGRLKNKNILPSIPEKYRLDKETFEKIFPLEDYGGESSLHKWPSLPSTLNRDIQIKGDGAYILHAKDLKTGYYKAIFTAQNSLNDTIKLERIVRIYGQNPEPILTMEEWLVAEKTDITPKESAVFRLAGLAEGSVAYYEVYHKGEINEKVWLNVSPIQTIIKILPKSNYENAIAVQFTLVQNGVVYNSLQTVKIHDASKELDIQFLSFRDKLQPGEKETWKLKIRNKAGEKQMAELAATLYDASLDKLKSMDWNSIHTGFNYGVYTWGTNPIAVNGGRAFWFLMKYIYPMRYYRSYERLNTMGTPHDNSSYSFNNYLKNIDLAQHKKDSVLSAIKLANLQKGTAVYGIVKDDQGFPLPDALISLNKKHTRSDRFGIYSIAAEAGETLHFSALGYLPNAIKLKPGQRRLNQVLKGDKSALNEVVIRGYQKRSREVTTGSSFIVSGKEVQDAPVSNVEQLLQGKVAGLNVQNNTGAPGMRGSVQIRGLNTISGNPNETQGNINIMNSLSKVVARTNFNETAFFYPQLQTNSAGEIKIEFTIPQSLTRYKMLGFAHTKDLMNTVVSRELITQKQFSIAASAPRFFREGDTIVFNAKLNNLSGKKLKGNAALQLSDALTGKMIQILMQGSSTAEVQKFELTDKGSQVLKWPLVIPSGISAITYKVVAESGKYSDGEEMTVPVLPNSMLVTETMPLNVRGNSSKTFNMDKLLQSAKSTTLRSQSYTLEFTSNPVWYAIQSLPYLMEYPYECAEQTFSRFYANSFASTIINSSPKIAEVFKQWQETDNGQALLSNLEKNQELKSILLEETPWVRNSTSESERKKRLGGLFDLSRMSGELKRTFEKLEQMQYPNGSFPWFSGMPENRYITQHIVLGMSQLKYLKVIDEKAYPNFNTMLNKAIIYLDTKFISDYIASQQGDIADHLPLHYLYARSYSKQINTNEAFITAFNYYLKKLATEWKFMDLYQQGLAALVLHRSGNHQEAIKIVNALKERSQISEEMGMFWPGNTNGWWWYQSSVETQALMVEVFEEVASDTKSVEELKIWLLKNKQTTDWKTTKATTAACYALLMRGHNLLEESAEPEILIADKTFAQLGMAEPKKEAGTGYRKVSVQGAQVTPELGKVTVKNNNKGIAWGGIYWQYFEQLDKITPAKTGIKINKQMFVQEQTTSGTVLHPLNATRVLKPGDLLKVRIEIYSDRDMEYLHLKDMRSSGFEPVNIISTYKYQDGLGYYESTKDASTNFFIGFMRKGTYVFEYPLRVSHAGNFSNGITTLQSMYAPEFSTHSQGIRVTVEP